MTNGTMVQTTSTVTDSWKLAAFAPLERRCFQIDLNITGDTTTKNANRMAKSIQGRKCCSCAILVAGGAKFNWRTAGPPGRSWRAWAAKPTHAPAISGRQASLLEMLFMVLTYSQALMKPIPCAYLWSFACMGSGGVQGPKGPKGPSGRRCDATADQARGCMSAGDCSAPCRLC